MHPNTSFYQTWQGYTLGTVISLTTIALVWLLGQYAVAPSTLGGVSAEERALRLRRFQTVCLSRSLMLLYLIYPGALLKHWAGCV